MWMPAIILPAAPAGLLSSGNPARFGGQIDVVTFVASVTKKVAQ